MSIKQFRVRDVESVYATYLVAQRAENHAQENNRRFPDDAPNYVEAVKISELARQDVVIDGDVVGYQFSATCQGQRCLFKKVTRLVYNEAGIATGVVFWQGKPYPVIYNSLNSRWYMAESRKFIPSQLYARHDQLLQSEVCA